MTTDRRRVPSVGGLPAPCEVADCDRRVYARGLCEPCYAKDRRRKKKAEAEAKKPKR